MQESFSGGVFSDTLSDGRAGADIELVSSGVCACTTDGEPFVIAYRDCQVEVGGFSGRMVFCRNADRSVTIFCEDRRFPKALSEASAGLLNEQLGAGIKEQRSLSRRAWITGTVSLVGILILLIGGYFGIRAAAGAAVHALPTSVDLQVGKQAMASMDLGGPKIENQEVVGAMQSMVDRLSPHVAMEGLQFQIHVVRSDEANAFALPGGQMVLYTGLIENADNPEQVAAVLAHEMSHATLRHGLQRISQTLGIWAGLSLLIGDAGGLIAAGAEVFQIATINSYSRDHENEADAEGVRMMHAARIDPSAMPRFFEKLEKKHGDLPGMLDWINTHPDHASRISSVERLIADLPEQTYEPVPMDWQRIQRLVKEQS